MEKVNFNKLQSSIEFICFMINQIDNEDLKKAAEQLKATYEEEREKLKKINEQLQNLVNKF